MLWQTSYRASVIGNEMAKRHYSCQSPDSNQFVPPGECLVLLASSLDAVWVTSLQKFPDHAWPGAWVCTLFRNESDHLATDLIRDAVAASRFYFGEPHANGMITFVNEKKVRPTMVRGKPVFGWTFRKVGFKEVGYTKSGKLALQLLVQDMPEERPAIGQQLKLFA